MSVVGHQRAFLLADAALTILRAMVARLGRAGKERAIFKRIDIDDAPHPIPINQNRSRHRRRIVGR